MELACNESAIVCYQSDIMITLEIPYFKNQWQVQVKFCKGSVTVVFI